jgi:hypothetical protein
LSAIIETIEVTQHRVLIKISPSFSNYFKEDFWFSCDSVDLRTLPQEILITPFILNIAPVIWACGVKATLPYIDATLKDRLPLIKQGFKQVYPFLDWSGEIYSDQVTHSPELDQDESRIALLFSGGVDSINLSQDFLQKEQILLTIRGADVKLDDDQGWQEVKSFVKSYADKIKAKNLTIESNFATFINHHFLAKRFFNIPEWWGMVQHGLGLAGFLVIAGWQFQPKKMLMASDLSLSQMQGVEWASVCLIMKYLQLPTAHFQHMSYELTRQEKINKLANKYRQHSEITPVRVCYASRGGRNCGKCRKCMLAMFGFLAAGLDYQIFGFSTAHDHFISAVKKELFTAKHSLNTVANLLWIDIQNHILTRSEYGSIGLQPGLIDVLMYFKAININQVSKKLQLRQAPKRYFVFIARNIPLLSTIYAYLKTKRF